MRPGAGWALAIALAAASIVAIAWTLLAEPGWRTRYPAGSSRSLGPSGASVAARLLGGPSGRAIELTHPVDFAALPRDGVVFRISAFEGAPAAREGTPSPGSAPDRASAEKEPACPPGSG